MSSNQPNSSSTFLPWASFHSFQVPPFSPFNSSSHHSYIRTDSLDIADDGSDIVSPTTEGPHSPYLPHQRISSPSAPTSPLATQRPTSPLITQRTASPLPPLLPNPSSAPVPQSYTSPIAFAQNSTPSHGSQQSSTNHTRAHPRPEPHRPRSPQVTQPTPRQSTYAFAQPPSSSSRGKIPILPSTTLETSPATWFIRRYAPPTDAPTPVAVGEYEQPYPGAGTALSPYLVDYLPGEPANPQNWNKRFKWITTLHLGFGTLCPVFTSSSYVFGIESMQRRFPGTSNEIAVLGLSLYLLGQAFGPLLWAPTSELIGRRNAFIISFPLFIVFNLVGAVAPNMATIEVVRFLAGVFGSAQLSNQAGQIADMWSPAERAIPGGIATLSPLLGPVLGPVICGFVGQKAGFRAIFWLNFGWGVLIFITWIFFVPETFPLTLLKRKAALLQRRADEAGTGEHFVSKYETVKKTPKEVLKLGFVRPFQMLFTEVIVWTLSLYLSVIYGILYLLFAVFPVIFHQLRGWSLGFSGLALVGIGIGMLIGFLLGGLNTELYKKARARIPAHLPVPPEVRIPVMFIGAIATPLSLFWFAWTCQPSVHWIVPIIASVPFGTGYFLIFTSIFIYLMDAYTIYAASALAANAVMRAGFGAAFPLFAEFMYRDLGVNWAGTLLAFLALALSPMPFLFYKYGPWLRRRSKYIPKGQPAVTPEMVKEAIEPETPVDREKARPTIIIPSSPPPGSTSRTSLPQTRTRTPEQSNMRTRSGYLRVTTDDHDGDVSRQAGAPVRQGEVRRGSRGGGQPYRGFEDGSLRPLTLDGEEADVGFSESMRGRGWAM